MGHFSNSKRAALFVWPRRGLILITSYKAAGRSVGLDCARDPHRGAGQICTKTTIQPPRNGITSLLLNPKFYILNPLPVLLRLRFNEVLAVLGITEAVAARNVGGVIQLVGHLQIILQIQLVLFQQFGKTLGHRLYRFTIRKPIYHIFEQNRDKDTKYDIFPHFMLEKLSI